MDEFAEMVGLNQLGEETERVLFDEYDERGVVSIEVFTEDEEVVDAILQDTETFVDIERQEMAHAQQIALDSFVTIERTLIVLGL
jgi:hypothetical protein